MTHEFKHIIQQALLNQQLGIANVLATVVHLEGSSYRKPGVRMLLSSDDSITGAVSGGCVEKEVQRRAKSVFETQIAKVIAYDGRYRLGCEGILYILLEPIRISKEFISEFLKIINNRDQFSIESFYNLGDESEGSFGSIVTLNKHPFSLNDQHEIDTSLSGIFKQNLSPLFRLLIIGGEHDAVKLCKQGKILGWQVDVITSIKDPKQLKDFPGANSVIAQTPEIVQLEEINEYTAIVIMNHNFSYDLRYLVRLQETNSAYIGVLGAAKRREKLFNELFELTPNVSEEFLDRIHTPAGLNIGAITPEEIALSIVAEILSVVRDKEVFSLKKIIGNIHS
ncbi:Xanthine and CO dehydrogenase maturation factor, XdhC/CoxF family [Tenacibaculum sp. MAR_2009_124]|uniref:XdhC family protein n=1 Tax=Tenacibaculum sp. MAR_2009_124 TaxID=1250059 RepID=UPI00089B7E8E|nr:XdhC/CoxI family protein [Tenacibaculum sp. MAR_2009_124]SED17676.1 Xanthine and CO dehydrogenase maturation factor, XdhC/CoxF family [Tenacibaculum sp. MAR_2009_124]